MIYKGFENLDGFGKVFRIRAPNLLAMVFMFGLIHGFGLSTRLQELALGDDGLISRILAFNVGVELGQLFVLALMVPALGFLFRRWLPDLLGTIVLSAFLAHTGWHWMTERGAELLQYDFRVPVMDSGFAATLLRWILLALIIVGAVWILRGVFGALPKANESAGDASADDHAETEAAAAVAEGGPGSPVC